MIKTTIWTRVVPRKLRYLLLSHLDWCGLNAFRVLYGILPSFLYVAYFGLNVDSWMQAMVAPAIVHMDISANFGWHCIASFCYYLLFSVIVTDMMRCIAFHNVPLRHSILTIVFGMDYLDQRKQRKWTITIRRPQRPPK